MCHDGVHLLGRCTVTAFYLGNRVGLGDDADHVSVRPARDDQRNIEFGHMVGRLLHDGPGANRNCRVTAG